MWRSRGVHDNIDRAREGRQSEDAQCKEPLNEDSTEGTSCPSNAEAPTKSSSSWWPTGLKILVWLLLWGFFVEVEFGAVYLVASGLVFIVLSLRGSRRRAPGQLSAYSVFNKNLEAIEGTLSAEQFEKELRYGPMSVKTQH